MHLAHAFQRLHSLMPIEHGGEFQDYPLCLLHQSGHQFEHIGRAILDAVGPATMLITTGRVQIDDIGMWHRRQVFCRLTTNHSALKSQRLHVMPNDRAEVGILFHIDALGETLRHEVEVDAKASCKVYIGLATTCQPGFVKGCGFRGTLFHREVGRINDAIVSSPGGQFGARLLSAGDLLKGKGQIDLRILCPLKCQLTHIGISMLTDKVKSSPILHFGCKDNK